MSVWCSIIIVVGTLVPLFLSQPSFINDAGSGWVPFNLIQGPATGGGHGDDKNHTASASPQSSSQSSSSSSSSASSSSQSVVMPQMPQQPQLPNWDNMFNLTGSPGSNRFAWIKRRVISGRNPSLPGGLEIPRPL